MNYIGDDCCSFNSARSVIWLIQNMAAAIQKMPTTDRERDREGSTVPPQNKNESLKRHRRNQHSQWCCSVSSKFRIFFQILLLASKTRPFVMILLHFLAHFHPFHATTTTIPSDRFYFLTCFESILFVFVLCFFLHFLFLSIRRLNVYMTLILDSFVRRVRVAHSTRSCTIYRPNEFKSVRRLCPRYIFIYAVEDFNERASHHFQPYCMSFFSIFFPSLLIIVAFVFLFFPSSQSSYCLFISVCIVFIFESTNPRACVIELVN